MRTNDKNERRRILLFRRIYTRLVLLYFILAYIIKRKKNYIKSISISFNINFTFFFGFEKTEREKSRAFHFTIFIHHFYNFHKFPPFCNREFYSFVSYFTVFTITVHRLLLFFCLFIVIIIIILVVILVVDRYIVFRCDMAYIFRSSTFTPSIPSIIVWVLSFERRDKRKKGKRLNIYTLYGMSWIN